ncbi:lanthionine synthetase LanC family protein [Bacteroides fragilis]
MISDTTIRKLVDYISLNACSVNSSGLYNGKSGISLALFETAKCLQDTEIEDKAFSLFQESLIRKTNDYGFENGMSGIGYVLIYLITNKLIDADFEDLFGDQREAIIKHFENIDKQPDKLLVSYKIIYFYLSWINYKSKMREYIQLLRKYFKDWNFIYHFSFSIGKIFIT